MQKAKKKKQHALGTLLLNLLIGLFLVAFNRQMQKARGQFETRE